MSQNINELIVIINKTQYKIRTTAYSYLKIPLTKIISGHFMKMSSTINFQKFTNFHKYYSNIS